MATLPESLRRGRAKHFVLAILQNEIGDHSPRQGREQHTVTKVTRRIDAAGKLVRAAHEGQLVRCRGTKADAGARERVLPETRHHDAGTHHGHVAFGH
jgi:hypothetical protein